jgi:hypothetical protein
VTIVTAGQRAARAGHFTAHPRTRRWLMWASLWVIVASFALATPRGAGPDEQQHLSRGAALVRGELNGRSDWPMTSYVWFTVPWWVTQPDPACYAFNPLQPASCSTIGAEHTAEVEVLSQTASYPPSAHVLAGLATLLPGEARTQWIARIFNAIVPVTLIGLVLLVLARSRSNTLLAAGALAALTPGVWFFVSVVNPSGWTAAGAFAMWAAVLSPEHVLTPRRAAELWVAGWCTMSLARFDGVAFALLVGVLGLVWGADALMIEITRRRGLMSLVVASTLVNLLWSVHYGRRQWFVGGRALLLGVAALVVAGAVVLVRVPGARLRLIGLGRVARSHMWALVVGLVAVPVALFFVQATRRNFPYAASVGNTGNSIREAIGVLSWVDTFIPDSAFVLWYLILGALIGLGVVLGRSGRVVYLLALLAGVVALQWLLQMELDYWHGRYLFPLTVGVPIVAAACVPREALSVTSERRAGGAIGVAVWIAWMLSFAQLMRRFGVSAVGVMNPWRWNTYQTVLHPVALLCLFGVASATLIAVTLGLMESREHRDFPITSDSDTPGPRIAQDAR